MTDGEGTPGARSTLDADGDGFGDPSESIWSCGTTYGCVELDTDCNDENSDIHPDAPELCDGIDNDCDTVIDGAAADGAATFVTLMETDMATACFPSRGVWTKCQTDTSETAPIATTPMTG